LATHYIRHFPLHFPSRSAPCAITYQLDSNCGKVTADLVTAYSLLLAVTILHVSRLDLEHKERETETENCISSTRTICNIFSEARTKNMKNKYTHHVVYGPVTHNCKTSFQSIVVRRQDNLL